MAGVRRRRTKCFMWERLPAREILDLRLCDLGVDLEDTWIEEPIEAVNAELAWRDLRVKPRFWLSEEWFSPDGIVGVAIPFYLAHPRLMRLERQQMLEVEGGTHTQCLKLLRHEVGHAIQHAFELQRRRRFTDVFGRSSRAYPDYYRPNPASKNYVLHLDYWYAQAHPDEDFAETFAVWLAPGSRWRKRYADWPGALRKLEYVDELMQELAGRAPRVKRRGRVEPLPQLKHTLREHYDAKQKRFSKVTSAVYDDDLNRLFEEEGGSRRRSESAASFLRRNRARIRHMVSESTGKHEYALDVVLGEMIHRCRDLRLRAVGRERDLLVDLAILVAARSIEYVYRYRGRDWHAM